MKRSNRKKVNDPQILFNQLSVRARNILNRYEIFNLDDLVKFEATYDLARIRGLGFKTYEEIIEVISSYNTINADKKIIEQTPIESMASGRDINPQILFNQLSVRARNILNRYEIFNLDDLVKFEATYDLARIRGLGFKTYEEIMEVIRPYKTTNKDNTLIKQDVIEDIMQNNETNYTNNGYRNPLELLKDMIEVNLPSLHMSRNFSICIKRADGLTLQEIGEQHNITRERVRQITEKFYLRLLDVMYMIAIDFMKSKGDKHITVQEILNIFDSDETYGKIAIYTLRKHSELEFLDFADLFLIKDNSTQVPLQKPPKTLKLAG